MPAASGFSANSLSGSAWNRLRANGLCDKVVRAQSRHGPVSHAATGVGEIKGKVAYVSPEQLSKGEVDRRTDIWSLGVVLWETTLGRRLFLGNDFGESVDNVLEGPIPKPSSVDRRFPGALESVVLSALERDPKARPATAAEMADALEAYIYSTGEPCGAAQLATLMEELFGERRQGREDSLDLSTMPRIHTGFDGTAPMEAPVVAPEQSGEPAASSEVRAWTGEAAGPDETIEDEIEPAAAPRRARPAPRRRRRTSGSLVAFVLVLCFAAGFVVWALWPHEGAPHASGGRSAAGVRPVAAASPDAASSRSSPSLVVIEPAAARSSRDEMDTRAALPEEDARAGSGEPSEGGLLEWEAGTGVDGPPPTRPARAARAGPRRRRPQQRPARPPAAEEVQPASGPPGSLNLLAIPNATVIWRGRRIGRTPLVERAMPPGRHALVVRDDDGAERTITVTIRSGETTRRTVRMR